MERAFLDLERLLSPRRRLKGNGSCRPPQPLLVGLFGMRLIAWNCCERLDRKFAHLSDLDFDVAVITEAGPFEVGLEQTREVTSVMALGVDQPGHTKHIAVLAQAPWRVVPLALPDDVRQPWLVAARVHGPVQFTVLAFWALGPEWVDGRLSYAGQAGRVITDVLPHVEGPVVFAGDFNAPVSTNTAEGRRHEANVAALSTRGLCSAFTSARPGVNALAEPTYFHQWKADQPFHIDHLFVPKEWTSHIEVTVGSFNEWVATGRSDHAPLIVDTDP